MATDHRPMPADPAVLYQHAPDLLTEAAELLTASSRLLTQTLAGDPPDEEDERHYALRRAVQADRVALAHPDPRMQDHAEEAARTLADTDRARPYLAPAGIPRPAADAPAAVLRTYVRACYDAAPWT
ncbi:hypothetical protein ACFV2Q_27720 [Streptomyces sp. NPDC059650]|uniref:hypothetical protein n=1 Tax=Streptomyces sp. NPDC059650 TaxID=3346896 RepID=UPI00369FD029